MRGSRRVIVFCFLTTILPTILIVLPLYLRNYKYGDVFYRVSESDVIQIHKGQSTVFCQKHSLKMNKTFSAFQMKGKPQLSNERRHIQLRKSMILPDDTLEYWGFNLFNGSTVELRVCSRYEGSKVLVVKGENILNTCGILEGSKYKKNPLIVTSQGQVSIAIQNPLGIIHNLGFPEKNKIKTKVLVTIKDNELNPEDNYNGSMEDHGNMSNEHKIRQKRNTNGIPLHNPNTVLDAGVHHGGNAANNSVNFNEDASISSFESSLYECYSGNIIINTHFPYSSKCSNTEYLDIATTLKTEHNVTEDGYYYYIFYSDNDIVSNEIHAIFDIYKSTFQYADMPESKMCVNKTECEFDIGFMSDERVIVEVPTRDGLKNDDGDTTILTSVCHPRTSIYVLFPVSVLLLILLFAFL